VFRQTVHPLVRYESRAVQPWNQLHMGPGDPRQQFLNFLPTLSLLTSLITRTGHPITGDSLYRLWNRHSIRVKSLGEGT
jgi:hypothetical protein